jgi:hypothetical protein
MEAWRAKVSKAIWSSREFSRDSLTGCRKSYGVTGRHLSRTAPVVEISG